MDIIDSFSFAAFEEKFPYPVDAIFGLNARFFFHCCSVADEKK